MTKGKNTYSADLISPDDVLVRQFAYKRYMKKIPEAHVESTQTPVTQEHTPFVRWTKDAKMARKRGDLHRQVPLDSMLEDDLLVLKKRHSTKENMVSG